MILLKIIDIMNGQKQHGDKVVSIYKKIILFSSYLLTCILVGIPLWMCKSGKHVNTIDTEGSQERPINFRNGITAVNDTFQIGRYVVGISLPQRSKIYIGKKPVSEEGDRAGVIFLDSLILKKEINQDTIIDIAPISIYDISLASCCGLSSEPDDVIRVLKSDTLANKFVIRVLKTADRYNVRAVSPHYGMRFEINVDSLISVDSVIKIYKTIQILPMRKYDNTKSVRPKGVATVRLFYPEKS